MTTIQRLVLIIASIGVLLIVLFPPWIVEHNIAPGLAPSKPAGYSPIWAPPDEYAIFNPEDAEYKAEFANSLESRFKQSKESRDAEDLKKATVSRFIASCTTRIDGTRLLFQFVGLMTISLLIVCSLREQSQKPAPRSTIPL